MVSGLSDEEVAPSSAASASVSFRKGTGREEVGDGRNESLVQREE